MNQLAATTEWMRLLSEPARVRLLSVLAEDELTVAELTRVTQLSQSRVSTHLGKLREAGFVQDRRVGKAAFYSLNEEGMDPQARRLLAVMAEATRDTVLVQDRRRAQEVIAARGGVRSWADMVAGQMERHYSPGRSWQSSTRGILGLCDLGDVLDIASGDGALASLIAPRARSVTCLDISPRVIGAARQRLGHVTNASFRVGDMHELPFDNESFDAVMLMSCLTYANDPQRVMSECRRVLRPGGRFSGVTLNQHDHPEHVKSFSHVNCGTSVNALNTLVTQAGLTLEHSAITSRETRSPHFELLTFFGSRSPESAAREMVPS